MYHKKCYNSAVSLGTATFIAIEVCASTHRENEHIKNMTS